MHSQTLLKDKTRSIEYWLEFDVFQQFKKLMGVRKHYTGIHYIKNFSNKHNIWTLF